MSQARALASVKAQRQGSLVHVKYGGKAGAAGAGGERRARSRQSQVRLGPVRGCVLMGFVLGPEPPEAGASPALFAALWSQAPRE